jgi:hypothetical protein
MDNEKDVGNFGVTSYFGRAYCLYLVNLKRVSREVPEIRDTPSLILSNFDSAKLCRSV